MRERYRLIERIGEGSQGQTFYAIHEFLSHPCVVKILPHRVGSASDAAVRRLRTEARVGFRVNDPHVIRVLDCDNVEGAWYFVMEYVDGADLAGMTERGTRLVWQQAVQVMRDVAHGLAAIHQAGLIHRDIKPSNLILGTDGRTRVADLGVVGLAESDDVRGQTDAAGTLAYAAPEVFASDTPVGAAADLYSLGATALHLLTGAAPHAGDSIFRSLIDSQSRPVAWPRERVADVPEWVIQLVLRLLSLDAKQRYESADSLAAFLDRPEPEAKPIAPALRPSEALQPRGVVILPFENASGQTGDEWLGIETPEGGWRLHKLDDLPLLTGRAHACTALVARDGRLLRLPLQWPALPGAAPTAVEKAARKAARQAPAAAATPDTVQLKPRDSAAVARWLAG
ncbi:MAG: serine/threonine protein kinase [Planctomycetes bacterium]|nr:serine/threonine protein kinase [Planctomycetota bacterium]